MAKQKNFYSVRRTRRATLHKPYSINGLKVSAHLCVYTVLYLSLYPLPPALARCWQWAIFIPFILIRSSFVSIFYSPPNLYTDWAAEAVPKAEILRLIYQGRFLHCNVTLGALVLPLGKTTVMHLVPRDNLPEPNSQGNFLFFLHS